MPTSSLDNLEIRPATLEDISKLVKLMNAQYKRKKKPSYFQWQYFDCPFPAILMCAFSRKKLVGMFGLQKKQLTIDTPIGQLMDLLIAPEWRRSGLFKVLAEKAFNHFKEVEAFIVMPNLSGKNACEKTLGMKTLQKIDMLFYQKNKNNPYLLQKKNKIEPFFQFKKNKNFYSWRFDNSPEYRYNKVGLNKKLFAYTKFFTDPITKKKYGDIVDFAYGQENEEKIMSLIKTAIEHFTGSKVESIATWAISGTKAHNILIKSGFIPFPQERYLCLKVFNKNLNKLNSIKNWHVLPADTDLF